MDATALMNLTAEEAKELGDIEPSKRISHVHWMRCRERDFGEIQNKAVMAKFERIFKKGFDAGREHGTK